MPQPTWAVSSAVSSGGSLFPATASSGAMASNHAGTSAPVKSPTCRISSRRDRFRAAADVVVPVPRDSVIRAVDVPVDGEGTPA